MIGNAIALVYFKFDKFNVFEPIIKDCLQSIMQPLLQTIACCSVEIRLTPRIEYQLGSQQKLNAKSYYDGWDVKYD